VLIIIALVVALLVKTFLIQAFYIPSGSMEETLQIGDRVLVMKIPYYLHEPNRGDVVVFEDPHPAEARQRGIVGGFAHWVFEGIGVQHPDNEDFIKRVIGLPNETVWAKGGRVFVDGTPLEEPYLQESTQDFPRTQVPEGQLFVMGDNRDNSDDSRFNLGFVPIDSVIGKASVIMWPPSRVGGIG
jgi:signal peptidase I